MRVRWLLPLLALAACRGTGGEDFPSLLPRPAETPRELGIVATQSPGLPPEMASGIGRALDGDATAIEQAATAIAAAETGLERALGPARGAAPGSHSWVEAQMALSRLDQERARLGEVRARLATLGPLLDGLPAEDALVARWQALVQRADALFLSAERRSLEASRRLGG